jgi:hypothetical protein
MSRKYALPPFLAGTVTQPSYLRWLHRKANAHVKRDRRRGNSEAVREAYRIAIHRAVCESEGVDQYTGEKLDWHLISRYDNEESKAGRRDYKASFALLPTVDHVGDGLGRADFKICGWRTNDAKNDLPFEGFIDLCRRVIAHSNARPSPTK